MANNQQTGPRFGAVVRDTKTDCFGVVMGTIGGCIQLRPISGGLSWEAEPDDIEALSLRKELTVRLAALNADSRRGV
ncbi:hypothetical protein OHA79_31515 [Streptomyces sp. NBC_00841]|uniref:hypothetical protein n=1 Tax=unclassified Streptomyces TaxID=2593676 RepID=UPI00224C9258|nr:MULTISPECIES: hypothetical protein [unclassified Streptomyces]MCX4532536.1 hypothetical protein [Streptomyces sp. NBC_01669]WSA01981.1 hypothetical protein OHA79_31515 [Streptomyces sp. NBC_00841]